MRISGGSLRLVIFLLPRWLPEYSEMLCGEISMRCWLSPSMHTVSQENLALSFR